MDTGKSNWNLHRDKKENTQSYEQSNLKLKDRQGDFSEFNNKR